MKKWVVLLVFVVAICLLPLLIPLNSYLKQAEQQATDVLGLPVTIGSARLMLLPTPRVVAHEVRVGPNDDLAIESLAVIPALSTVFSAQRAISLAIDHVTVKASALAAYDQVQAKLAGSEADAAAPVLVQQVSVTHLDISALIGLPVMQAQAELAHNALQKLTLEADDHSLLLDLLPQGDAQSLHIVLHDFKLPNHQINVDQGDVQAVLRAQHLDITRVQLGMLGGQVTGQGALAWPAKAKAQGSFQLQGLSMQALTHTGRGPYLSGSLSGAGTLKAEAAQLGELLDRLLIEADLQVRQGLLHGIDLVKIAKLLLKQGAQGGETAFDILKTQLKVQGKRAQFRQMELQSGLMTGKGNVTVLDGKQLQGEMTVAVKSTGGVLEVPLEISGPVEAPTVLPDKAATVGAVVGTALMPGVGTSLGIKAGSQLKKLFGGEP